MTICNTVVPALVDTGSSCSLVSLQLLSDLGLSYMVRSADCCSVLVANGNSIEVKGEATLNCVVQGEVVSVRCVVLESMLNKVDFILGMDLIHELGGVIVDTDGAVFKGRPQFVSPNHGCVTPVVLAGLSGEHPKENDTKGELKIEEQDFHAEFSGGRWVVKWIWKSEPPKLVGNVGNYKIKEEIRERFEEKVDEWIEKEWLIPYDGEVRAYIPLMAVEQPQKSKVRPVLDYRRLNEHIKAYTGDSDACDDKIRAWRALGSSTKILDLKDAYLQLHVDPSLWPYQVVRYKGKTYCLTRLGFGLNCAPRMMTHVLRKVLSLDPNILSGTDNYIDDIVVDETIVSADFVKSHLENFGLRSKPVETLAVSRVLGLQIEESESGLKWSRGNDLPCLSPEAEELSRSDFFSVCGKLVGHYPVCGWLRVSCSYAKRICEGARWSDKVGREAMKVLGEIIHRVQDSDPVGGVWQVKQRQECEVWCDASSLALGVVVEVNGKCIEDGAWLRKVDDGAHINLAELDAVVRGVNLALKWKFEKMTLYTDSATVFGWLTSVLYNSHKPRIYGLSEMLVKRRLQLVREIQEECGIRIEVILVRSSENKADKMTRVQFSRNNNHGKKINNEIVCFGSFASVKDIHEKHHFGAHKTLHACLELGFDVDIDQVRDIIQSCERCKKIDPQPITWDKGKLEVDECWKRLACDVTHYQHDKFLTIIDCGPSRFAIWRRIPNESGDIISRELVNIFRERGPPVELLLDNSLAFRSEAVKQVCDFFGVCIRFRCAYRPSGNGIIERNHRTIKRTASRSEIDPLSAVFWYNILPRLPGNPNSAPSTLLEYRWRLPIKRETSSDREGLDNIFAVGDTVFVKPPVPSCTTEWRKGQITNVNSSTNVDVDGIPRHIADLRRTPLERDTATDNGFVMAPDPLDLSDLSEEEEEEKDVADNNEVLNTDDVEDAAEDFQAIPSPAIDVVHQPRSRRNVRLPARFNDFVLE